MSAYVVDNGTISVIAKGIVEYGIDVPVEFDDMALILVNLRYKPIGQWLLEQNYKSVDYRYSEETEIPEFEYEEPKHYNEGILLGCLRCWNYQACETPGYDESEFARMVRELEHAMLNRMIERKGMQIPWGYDDFEL